MQNSPISLWDSGVPGLSSASPHFNPTLKPFLLDQDSKSPVMIVIPGGGYHIKAPHEADPVARWLNAIGISAFVLDYRVFPYRHPYPMLDGLRAVRVVRAHASDFNINRDRIGVLGFSAGGHLAATISTHWDVGNMDSHDPIETVSSRPDAQILCYPVITFCEDRHIGSMEALIGDSPTDELRQSLSAELQVNDQTPPAFMFHTANDQGVPVENSLKYAKALGKNDVPFDLHIFMDGPHGVGLAPDDEYLKPWTFLCQLWLKKIGFLVK
jgi:acetyl esterase/lipase